MIPSGAAARIQKSALSIACIFLALLPCDRASAKDETPRQFLQSIYKSYSGKGAEGVDWRSPEASRYFDERLTKLIIKDLTETEGEVGRLNADPFIGAQDSNIRELRINIIREDVARARAVASFINFSRPMRIELDLVKTPQGWRISNIIWPRWKADFVSLMSGPLVPEK